MTTEALQSILVIAEQSRNWENACALIAELAKEALSQPTPLAPWTREIERALGAAALLHAHVERPIIDRGEDKPQWLIDAGADIHAARMAILSRPAPTVCPDGWKPGGLADIATERHRQIETEGWAPEHDDAHGDGSLALAAACYAMFASVSDAAREATTLPASLTNTGKDIPGWSAWLEIWPWDRRWWKPKDRRRDLVRAGALIVAEIERLDRLAAAPLPPFQKAEGEGT